MSNTITPDALLAQMRAIIEQAQGQGAKPVVEQTNQGGFSDLLKSAVNSVNDNQQEAAKLSPRFRTRTPGYRCLK